MWVPRAVGTAAWPQASPERATSRRCLNVPRPDTPDYQTLMLPVLRLAAEGETTILKVVERIGTEFGLSRAAVRAA